MNIYDLKVKKRDGKEQSLSDFKGKVLLIVNTATGCGFTPQYEGLETLYKKYHDEGFEVLDFPCDQFGHQAPGTDSEIHEFCRMKYDTSFDQYSKVLVNGEGEEALYTYLKTKQPTEEVIGLKNKAAMAAIRKVSKSVSKDGDIIWNFTKFLVSRDGNVVKRYDPTFKPLDIESDIVKLLDGE